MERLLKRAEVLSLQGDTGGQKDAIVNELLKVHSRFQARIAEYQLLLNMTIQFFKNLAQVRTATRRRHRRRQPGGVVCVKCARSCYCQLC